jgi:hypothetical protein
LSDQAKLIAKQTFTPCYGISCPNNDISMMMNFPSLDENKVFPEEVENVNAEEKK